MVRARSPQRRHHAVRRSRRRAPNRQPCSRCRHDRDELRFPATRAECHSEPPSPPTELPHQRPEHMRGEVRNPHRGQDQKARVRHQPRQLTTAHGFTPADPRIPCLERKTAGLKGHRRPAPQRSPRQAGVTALRAVGAPPQEAQSRHADAVPPTPCGPYRVAAVPGYRSSPATHTRGLPTRCDSDTASAARRRRCVPEVSRQTTVHRFSWIRGGRPA